MENLSRLDCIDKLLTQASFSANEASKLGMSSALLAYYIKKGLIRRLGKGVYQGVDYKYSAENSKWEDLIEAVNSVPGGVVCLVSAFALYGITQKATKEYWIGVPHSTSIKRDEIFKIVRFRNMELGKTTIDLNGIQIPVFDRERTIIDSFRLLDRETGIKALKIALIKKGTEKLDLKRLQDYANKLRVNIEPYLLTALI